MSEQKAAIERNGEATLLVVDDEPEIVALLDEYFTGLGYRVLTAEDGATALKRAEQSPDLIVLDVGMPLMDGYAVCRRLREHLTCPILFLTARVEDVDALEGFEAGADDYVLKPFSLAVLGARVKAQDVYKRQGMDVTPLWWAVSLGACLGGNGTLIGASANVVLSDISKKHGYEITFAKFFKTGFPIMLLTILIAGVYLVVRFPPA